MKKKYHLILCLAFFANFLQAQTTEDFETETAGTTSFTDNGQVFNISSQSGGSFDIFYDAVKYGWNGTASDNTFIDNGGLSCSNANPGFTISSSGAAAFKLNKFYIYLGLCNSGTLTNTGTLTVTGKLGGITKYTATLASGTSNMSLAFQNGYTLIDLSTLGGSDNSNTDIDEFVISTTGSYEYASFDAMTWQKITCPAVTVAKASQTNIACNGSTTGAAAVNASGGTGLTYNWTPGNPTGDGTASVTGLSAGTWTCTVTNSCGSNNSTSFTITQPTALAATAIAQTNVSCNGGSNGSATVAASGGTPGYTYSWAPTGGTATTATGLSPGAYTVTITDANACTATKSFIITQPSAITLTPASQTNASCNGAANGAASVNTPTGGVGGYTYNWTPGNPSGDGTTSVSGLTAGTWTCTVTDANACTTSQSFTITQPSAITLTPASQTNISCNGGANGAATVNTPTGGTSGYTYNWSPGTPPGDGTTSVTGLTAGTWTCTVTDANACTASQSFTITQPSAIALTPASQTNIACNGAANGAAAVNTPTGGAGGYTYNWTPGNPTGDGTTSVTGLTAGTWTCTVTDANACTTSQSFTITQPSAITLTPASQTNIACFGGSTGAATVNTPTGGAGGYTYNWTPGNPTGDGTAAVSGLTAGTWTCTVTDANACTASQSFTITQPTALVATPIAQTNVSCNGGSNGSATVAATGGTAGYTYVWSNGENTATASGLIAGTYTVTITDANSCMATKSFTISEPTILTAILSSNNVSCPNAGNGSATITASGGTSPYTYLWSTGETTTTISNLIEGNYTVTVTDANNCSILKSINIGVNPDITAPIADITNLPDINSYCSISSAEIAVPTATDNCSGSINATTSDPLDYTSEGNYIITWNYNDGNGNSSTQTQKINILASPLAVVSLTDSDFTYNGNLHTIEVANLPTGANVTYSILPATGNGNGAINAGSYTVTATVTPGPDAINCGTVTLTATLNIIKAPQQITFNPIPAKNLGTDGNFNLSANSNSNLPVYYTYTSSPLTAATVSSEGAVTILGSGQVTILAHQDGNTNYLPADNVSQVMIINSNNSSITKITIGNQTYDNPSQVINYVVDCGETNATINIITETNSTVIPGNNFIVKTPQAGIYKQIITVASQDGTTSKEYTLTVEKQFDFLNIVTQKFDNVLLVNNNPLTNGGYEFVSYEWYKNNQLVGTNQYYSAGDDSTNLLDPSAEYHVKMTTVGGEVLQSCSAKIDAKFSYQAKLYPNPVDNEKIITIEADFPVKELEKMQISIYTISGKLIKTLKSSSSKTQIQLPPTAEGNLYFVVLETPNIKKSLKVIVNK